MSGGALDGFTTLTADFDYYNESALLERLTAGTASSGRAVVFLVGSGLTAPVDKGLPGVPGVDGVIELIEQAFDDESQRNELRDSLRDKDNRYQEAFRFLYGRRGPQAANIIIRNAVASARLALADGPRYTLNATTSDEACRAFDADIAGWHLTPGVSALGELLADYPDRCGRTVLTTNFDPLIGTAIGAAGGTSFRTHLHRDGNLTQTAGTGTHIVHLHGYWYGSDTLHTPRQLGQPRPQLRASLSHLIRDQPLVVLAYGGWDDAFSRALIEVVLDDSAFPEIIWCFRDAVPRVRTQLLNVLMPGIDRGRVSLYGGINCNQFLPKLLAAWKIREQPLRVRRQIELLPTAPFLSTNPSAALPSRVRLQLLNADEDRPPILEYYVGREQELAELESSPFRVAFITGIGGQGKSALAASFFNSVTSQANFEYRCWRDCKEQSEKFEDNIVSLIELLNDGRVKAGELAKQPIETLANLFSALTEDLSLLVVFDNMDHYVDLETRKLTGSAGDFIHHFLAARSKARLVITCRPSIEDSSTDVISSRLEGLGLSATIQLFKLRRAEAGNDSIHRAHDVTKGHAFWLDLLAAQVANRAPKVALENLLDSISTGSGEIPDATIRSIWQSLRDREQIVLQALAETLRPTSALQLSDYLWGRLRYNQMSRAIRVLRDLNLLVIKSLDNGGEGYELHPIIAAFIRKTFKRAERVGFIEAILAVYSAFFGVHRDELGKRPQPGTVRRWIEGAELCINAGHYSEAFRRLAEVKDAMARSEPPGEFVRVAELLLSSVDVKDWAGFSQFDGVFTSYHRILVNFGRLATASEQLDRYSETLSGKDARYINYCDMQAYMHWMHHNYPAAIKWGKEGTELKKNSGVDTTFDSAHMLALAQRDSGAIDPALEYFLEGSTIGDVLAAQEPDPDRGGAFYGNIGRCLQLMGQIDPALVCYRKSAVLIERGDQAHTMENQCYIRQWIGELLLAGGQRDSGFTFLEAAFYMWTVISPPKADLVRRLIEKHRGGTAGLQHDSQSAEAFAIRWINAPS